MNMLRCVFVCPEGDLSRELEALLARIPAVKVVRSLAEYPSPDELLRIVRVRKINLLVICVDDDSHFEALAAHFDNLMPGLPIITVGSRSDTGLLSRLMHLGIRDHLTSPISVAALSDAIKSVEHRLQSHPLPALRQSDLYTFLPAKPGVGTSTIAVSTSCALAEDLGAGALLLDCDLAAGAIQFLLKLGHSASIVAALEHSGNLDEDLWHQMVGRWGKLEVLHAGELNPPSSIDLPSLTRVLSMARAQYEVICADLASSFDPFSVALMRESRTIFLVTTPEIIALHLAAARHHRLTDLGLGDRVRLLLNRKARSELTDAEVSQAVGLPVSQCFSNDYASVRHAILEGSPVPRNSDLGQSILNLAHSLASHLEPQKSTHRHKFLDFFRVPHVEDRDVVWRD
jgi:pilus assembly protein CpaE